jgi:large subunit ribosomal protein L4
MKTSLYNQEAVEVGKVELNDSIFALPLNRDLVYQVTVSQISNKRQVIAHAKGRSEVRGGGKKPWRQKGTGRARHGSNRSPIWKGGGVTHGPTKEANFKRKINRKMAQKAMYVVLSEKQRAGQVAVIDSLVLADHKTKLMMNIFRAFKNVFPGFVWSKTRQSSVLVMVPSSKEGSMVVKATKNIPFAKVIQVTDANALQLLSSK